MKNVILILLIGIPFLLNGQFEYGWKIYELDSLKIEKFRDGGNIKSIGVYTNGQLKYTRISNGTGIIEPVEYFSRNGELESIVDYKKMTYELIDSSHLINYQFVDTCILIVKEQLFKNFGISDFQDLISIDGFNSSQSSNIFNKYSVRNSKLYQPENYQIGSCRILVSTQTEFSNRIEPIINFRIDSTMKIVESNIDLKKSYDYKFPIKFAESIKSKFNWKNEISENLKRGIKVQGPFLEIRNNEIKWIIQRQAGTMSSNPNFDNMQLDDYVEEIIIDAETGNYVSALKFVGSPNCN